MKNAIFPFMICAFLSTNAQDTGLVDDAVQGTAGNHQQQYVGTWRHNTTSPDFYNGTLSYSNQTNAFILLTFVGNGVFWVAEKKSTHGIARVSLDGGTEMSIDLYSATAQRVTVYTSPNTLPQGTHTLKIRVSGTKSGASTGYYIVHDYFSISQFIPPLALPDISNTRFGDEALFQLSFGVDNTAVGYSAMSGTLNGSSNTAFGSHALQSVDKGYYNTAVGHNALSGGGAYIFRNTAVGYHAMDINQPGEHNTAIGAGSGPAVSDLFGSTALGSYAKTTANYQVRIGSTAVTSIGGQVSWSTLSDGRFKRDIKEDVSGLEFINGLRPVSYTIDKDAVARFLGIPDAVKQTSGRTKAVRQTGFVAQEVDALITKTGYVFNGVDIPQNDADPYTIRYAEFVVPLVKAVQELTAKVEEQRKEIEALKKYGPASNDLLSTSGIVLYQNNPNPFSADTDIKMVVPESAHQVNIMVYTLEGKQLKNVSVDQRGEAAVTIQGNELNPGMYLYALIVDGKVMDTKRMILTK